MEDKNQRIAQYQENYLGQYGFENVQVAYRRQALLERLHVLQPQVVVEVGCGVELLYEQFHRDQGAVERWIIVEPGESFHAVAAASDLPNLTAIRGFFEEVVEEVRCALPRSPDLVICSSVLHEVPAPGELLAAARRLMGETSILHINVPNANSFHRRLAKSMGLIQAVGAPSERNMHLLQYRVYDRDSLRMDIEAVGLSVVREGGYFVKPFTHAQMEKISPELGQDVLDGLYRLGQEMPDLASEIFVEAQPA